MKKYLLLLEDHKSGFLKKGDVMVIPASSLDAWMETGIVEEVTKKDFDNHNKTKAEKIEKESADARKKHIEKTAEIEKKNNVIVVEDLTNDEKKEIIESLDSKSFEELKSICVQRKIKVDYSKCKDEENNKEYTKAAISAIKEALNLAESDDVTAQINELDIEGLKEYVKNRKLDLEITDDMTLEDARGFVLLAEEEKSGN